MQNDPEKILNNYNEYSGAYSTAHTNFIDMPEVHTSYEQEIINTGINLVNNKINQILGIGNKLTSEGIVNPKVIFDSSSSRNCSGYFRSDNNEIHLIQDKIKGGPLNEVKVFIHEYLHFLSHNGRDNSEQLDKTYAPIAKSNNVGLWRTKGLDIRKGREGEVTGDYFLSFNEAVTEQLAIDTLPNVHETYGDYRGLLNQVIDDAVTKKIGTLGANGKHLQWTREQTKNYIYRCFLRGDLDGFSGLLAKVYKGFDISEQQFGLMTNKDDLPLTIVRKWEYSQPGAPPPPPDEMNILVQHRLDAKTPDDYTTDVFDHPPGDDDDAIEKHDMYRKQYNNYIKDNQLKSYGKIVYSGREYEIDNYNLIIYHGDEAASILSYIKQELNSALLEMQQGKISGEDVVKYVDELLFSKHKVSMLTDGFQDFFVYKHVKLDEMEGK